MKHLITNNIVKIESIGQNNKLLQVSFEFLSNKIIRIYRKKCKTDLIELFEVADNRNFSIYDNNDYVTIKYYDYELIVDKDLKIFLKKSGKLLTTIEFSLKEQNKETYYQTSFDLIGENDVFGLGDKMGPLSKKGYFYQTRNTDDPTHQDELYPALYKSVPYMLFSTNQNYFGTFFPSTFKYSFDIAKSDLNKTFVNNFKSNNDFYLILGDNPQEILSNYSSLVGHPYFVRLKMLGYSQSRWSYENEEQVRAVAESFKKYDLPIDYIHLDIHYLDGYRDFTVDKARFKNMSKLTKYLKTNGIDVVAINDAAIKKDANYDIYKYLIANNLVGIISKKPYVNIVWPGKSVFPNYLDRDCKDYFKKKATSFLEKTGISGLRNDMNEPASFKGELPLNIEFNNCERKLTNEEVHNVYGEHMVRSFVDTFKEKNIRPYLFSRAAFATTAKYAFVWNGDNFSLWHHLKYSITQNLSLSMSNFMFNGVDIGGFGGDTTKELLIRWLQADLFMPFLRNHSSLNTKFQEPYMFDAETIELFRKFLKIRYDFTPYLYNYCHLMSTKGIPIVRPLFYNFPDDKEALKIGDQYMVGDNIMVAPILENGKNFRSIYFPKGRWINYLTNEIIEGESIKAIKMNLADSGYFIKDNSIIPNFENITHIEKKEIDTLVLKIFGTEGSLSLYDDDGVSMDYERGVYNIYDIKFEKNKLEFTTKYQKYNTVFKKVKILINNRIIIKDFNYNQTIDVEAHNEND